MSSKNILQTGKIRLTRNWIFTVLVLAGVCLSGAPFSNLLAAKNSYHYLIIEIKPDADAAVSLETVINVFANRLNAMKVRSGVEEFVSDGKKNNQLIVKLYGTVEPERLKRIKRVLLETNKLELRKAISEPSPSPLTVYQSENAAREAASNEQIAMPLIDRSSTQSFVLVEKKPILTGADVRDAFVNFSEAGFFSVGLSLKPEGALKLKQWTSANINNYLAIILDGKVRSAPVIKSVISDAGQIDGKFTMEEVQNLALILKSGYLPVSVKLLKEDFHGKNKLKR